MTEKLQFGEHRYEKHILAIGIFIMGMYFIAQEIQFIPAPASPVLVGAVIVAAASAELAYDRWYLGLIFIAVLALLFAPLLISPKIDIESKKSLILALACIGFIAAAPAALMLHNRIFRSGKS